MKIKILEVRDEGTRIDVIAISMTADTDVQRHYLWSHGYPKDAPSVGLVRLSDWKATNDPYEWASLGMGLRTMQAAHDYIQTHFDQLAEGDVVDVQYILQETATPKWPERIGRSAA